SVYIEDLLGELDGFRGATVGDLLDLMRRYKLQFGPVDDPDGRRVYPAVHALLKAQCEALGVSTLVPRAQAAGGPSSVVRGAAARYLERAKNYQQRGQYDRAIAEYSEAIRRDPEEPEGYIGRANALRFSNALGQRSDGWERAIADCTEAIRLDPGAARAHAI